MRIRVVQMLNNYYKDEEDKELISEVEAGTALGEYCCLGYFDALHIELVEYEEGQEKGNVRSQINEIIVKKFEGHCNIRNVVCVTYDDAKDDKFWKEAEKMPFLFMSLANIRYMEERVSEKLSQLIGNFNNMDHVMAYYTYDHSEIVVLRTAESYTRGFQEMLSLYESMNIFKMYTIFAVREDVLESCEDICEEIIDCRLYATVKDWDKVENFRCKLSKELQRKKTDIKMDKTLGNNDCLMEIPQISIKKILYYYKMGRLLSHTNPSYNQGFFNIESQFLVGEKEDGSMGD